MNRIQAFVVPPCRLRLASLRVALLASAASATLVTPCLTPLAGFAAPGITLKDSFASYGSNGAHPYAALTAAGNGLYYGTTAWGGANGNGAIFEFDSATGLITLKDSFASDGSNGAHPYAALTAAGNGLYYGTTIAGGANGNGAIFAFDSGVRDSNPVPGPLPVVGIGAAFSWSRQLRRRVAQVSPRKA